MRFVKIGIARKGSGVIIALAVKQGIVRYRRFCSDDLSTFTVLQASRVRVVWHRLIHISSHVGYGRRDMGLYSNKDFIKCRHAKSPTPRLRFLRKSVDSVEKGEGGCSDFIFILPRYIACTVRSIPMPAISRGRPSSHVRKILDQVQRFSELTWFIIALIVLTKPAMLLPATKLGNSPSAGGT